MRLVAVSAVVLWLAAGCQQGLSPALSLGWSSPDFLLISLGTLGLFAQRRGATILGFVAGVVHGGISGANLASYAISRTVAGFLVGWVGDLELESSPVMAFLSVAAVTVVAQLMLMFAAPPGAILPYLGATIGSAVYNGVLAMPFYALLQRILDPSP